MARETNLLKSFTQSLLARKKELVEAISHCRPAMALPLAEREAIINWLSSN